MSILCRERHAATAAIERYENHRTEFVTWMSHYFSRQRPTTSGVLARFFGTNPDSGKRAATFAETMEIDSRREMLMAFDYGRPYPVEDRAQSIRQKLLRSIS